jgi:hypothetical protein
MKYRLNSFLSCYLVAIPIVSGIPICLFVTYPLSSGVGYPLLCLLRGNYRRSDLVLRNSSNLPVEHLFIRRGVTGSPGTSWWCFDGVLRHHYGM